MQTEAPSCQMPQSVAIFLAVKGLSPVHMRTVTPAPWHVLMAAGTSGRT
jgi:hypothetical protein